MFTLKQTAVEPKKDKSNITTLKSLAKAVLCNVLTKNLVPMPNMTEMLTLP